MVQDRDGKVIYPENWRACQNCNQREWDGKSMPRPRVRTRQAIDPLTAYQVVHILEGVVQRGTATTLRDLNRPLMGKTGTSSGPTNVWFIGGSPDLIGGRLYRLRSAAQPGRVRPGRHRRRADLQAIRHQGVRGDGGRAVPRAARASAWCGSTADRVAGCSAPGLLAKIPAPR